MKLRNHYQRALLEAHYGGTYAGRRECWLQMARIDKEAGRYHLVPVAVGFARAAHHAYMKSAKRALYYQKVDVPAVRHTRALLRNLLGELQ